MNRYGRPLGLGLALGVSGVTGCSASKDSPDALPAGRDAYGVADMPRALDTKPAKAEVGTPDVPADTRDVLPPRVDAYGVARPDVPIVTPDLRDAYVPIDSTLDWAKPPTDASDARLPDGSVDGRDALPYPVDIYGAADRPVYKDVLPTPVDAYGMVADRPSDSPGADAGRDGGDAD
jgi:hypothetical protein